MADYVQLDCGICYECCRLPAYISFFESQFLEHDVIDKARVLKRDAEGVCVYYDRSARQCGNYADRPECCRMFDCRAHIHRPNIPVLIKIAGKLRTPVGDG